jgi:NAD(P)-dependent dehydrogenase (short-subunit alcohol dehydrogenase family)
MPKNPIKNFLYTQLFTTPPPVCESFMGKTIIITGASAGLGLSAAQQIANLNADRVILACRSVSKGEAAKHRIAENITSQTRLEVWPLDLTSFESINTFASRVGNELDRVDGLISNAGILTAEWRVYNGEESQIMTHVIGPVLLCLLLKEKLAKSSATISIVGSDMHHFSRLDGWADVPEGESILESLRKESTAKAEER